MSRLTVIHKCSYCLEKSYLFDVDVMVIPCVFMKVDMDSSHSQDWLYYWSTLVGQSLTFWTWATIPTIFTRIT